MTMSGLAWVIVGYLAGALVLLIFDVQSRDRWHADELAALLLWPVVVPVVAFVNQVQRYARTCRVCHRRYQNRAAMLRHCATSHNDRLPAPKVNPHHVRGGTE